MSNLAYHRDDPDTSKDAAQKAAPRAKGHAAVILKFLGPVGYTASYISAWLKNHPDFSRDEHTRLYQVRRRLSDLKRDGLAKHEGRCGDEITWRRA